VRALENNRLLTYIEENYLLLLIILLGVVLRIYNLGGESIWLDEAYTIEISKHDPVGIIREIFRDNENHPPLYYSIMHYWMILFGDSAFAVRFLSVIFGVMSITAIYKVAEFLFNKNTALISALILATSVFFIKYSQAARGYSLMAFLSLLSFYFLLRLLDHKSFKFTVFYLVTSLLLIYTHYYALLIIASQNIFVLTGYILSRDKKIMSLRRWIMLQLVLLLFYLPQLFFFVRAGAIKEGYWITAPNLKMLPGTIYNYSGSWPLFILLSILCVFAVVNPIKIFRMNSLSGYIKSLYDKSGVSRLSDIQKLYLLVVWLFTPIIVPFLVSVLITPVLQLRYTIGGAAAFFILAGKGAGNLRNTMVSMAIALVIIVFSLVNVYGYYGEVDKHQWRETVNYIESVADTGDVIMVYPSYDLKTGLYYLKRDDLEMIGLSRELLSQLDEDKYNFWVVISRLGSTEKESLTYELLRDYHLESLKEFHKLKLYHYRK
jgi:mannosyltransferase